MAEAFHITRFVPLSSSQNGPVTKFGGQPYWMAEAAWPVSTATGKLLRFIGQVDLNVPPFKLGKMAYLYVEIYDAELDKYFEDNWSVILQEKGSVGLLSPMGPSVSAAQWYIEGNPVTEPNWLEMESQGTDLVEQENWKGFEEFVSKYGVAKIGGSPVTPEDIHNLEEPPSQWQLLLQLPEREENGKPSDLPFYMDYGDGGTGWFLFSPSLQAVHFSWTSG